MACSLRSTRERKKLDGVRCIRSSSPTYRHTHWRTYTHLPRTHTRTPVRTYTYTHTRGRSRTATHTRAYIQRSGLSNTARVCFSFGNRGLLKKVDERIKKEGKDHYNRGYTTFRLSQCRSRTTKCNSVENRYSQQLNSKMVADDGASIRKPTRTGTP